VRFFSGNCEVGVEEDTTIVEADRGRIMQVKSDKLVYLCRRSLWRLCLDNKCEQQATTRSPHTHRSLYKSFSKAAYLRYHLRHRRHFFYLFIII
jgi:hypothetical protein